MKKITILLLLIGSLLSAFAQLSKDQAAKQTPLLLIKEKYLLNTQWDQWGIYAKYTPKQQVLGCWSTALAQILYYHRLKPFGNADYTCSNGYVIKDTLSKYNIRWSHFRDILDKNTPEKSTSSVALYSYLTAIAVRKDFGSGRYLEIVNPAPQIERHFSCDAEFYGCFTGNLPFTPEQLKTIAEKEDIQHIIDRSQITDLIQKEINNKRPIYFHFGNFSNYGHSTVIDGYCKQGNIFYVHINYGANGFRNGWYDLFSPIDVADDIRLRAFVTIHPK
ncbi:C10 family peptidase [Pedobacter nutrimenti]|uniref:C10 family peptidase n=1 Tax=Pedobacter nutrimenti TaxID=1241337 RepID=UPI00292FAD20|nr:C10 family peptidase [Pedobacter nutrimenti]